MKFFAAIAALAVAAVANAQYTFTNCATGATDMTVTGFTLNPYPLCAGQNVCATITGTLSNPVTSGGSLSVIGRYLNKIVYTDSFDLCTVLSDSGVPCPIATTVTSVTACILVKDTAPVGIPVVLNILANNGNGHVLFNQCATVTAANCPA
ncbi:hypothetical protein EMPS_10386 [Entomortierella parvispora]|uniref:Phosphatidylglycerol/phosphatidylinositol transfer protein n=1 Tax=Entomortierella parvispora TaxID=205924 RepID=A0A9P3HJY0_9FUNG|nr:hypothetical protein EMPS_10386 [Entomortierella parvispora]